VRFSFAKQFVRDNEAIAADMSTADRERLDELIAGVVSNPRRPGRFPAFYDPDQPSGLLRAHPFLVHYAYRPDGDEVTFLNLFRRR